MLTNARQFLATCKTSTSAHSHRFNSWRDPLLHAGILALTLAVAPLAGALGQPAAAVPEKTSLDQQIGQPADVAGSAYGYRADRRGDENPPESWILLMQYAGLPYDKPVDVRAPAIRRALCGLLWEEVRPVRQVELSWPSDAKGQPSPDEMDLAYFDATDNTAHT